MARERRKKPRRTRREEKRECYFCQTKKEPDFKDPQLLAKFLSPRVRILPRSKTGTCAKHQRRLTEAIKRGRHLALLPFVTANK